MIILALFSILLLLGTGAAQDAQGQALTVLHTFSGTDGRLPLAGLITDAKGNFYGTTREGGTGTCYPNNGCGTVFELDASGNFTVLHKFTSTGGDGAGPFYGTLVMDSAGNLYGTTIEGGNTTLNNGLGFGVVFKVDSAGNETVLHTFTGPDGETPNGLAINSGGMLYGTSNSGGASAGGDVFEMDTSGNITLLHSFAIGTTDGQTPYAAVIIGPGGNLYGTTSYGGVYGSGTVFKVDTSGAESVLYSFNNTGNDGINPKAPLAMDSAGNLYGTTASGGDSGFGTVFKLDSSGTESVLHSFSNAGGDGGNPASGLIIAPDGFLYGTTVTGGQDGYGTIFKMDSSGTETVLYSFTDANDGAYPTGSLLMDAAGNLFGTASAGGADGYGTVFGVAPVKLSASSISFGSVAVNSTTAAQSVTITNIGGGNFSYSSASISGTNAADFSVTNGCSTAVAPSGTCSVSVAFTPSTTSAEAATLNLSQAGMTQTISLSGTGVNPTASLSASSLTFSSQPVGSTSSSQTVTLTNNSGVTLDITAVSITGDFAIASNNCNTVAASGKCTVGVTFTPTAGGTRTGTLTFTDNASNSPQNVNLTGQGQVFALAATTTSETIAPGGTTTFDLLLSPQGGFNQSVSLACSGAPTGATCTVSPTSVTLDGTHSSSVGVKVTTTGSAMVGPGPGNFTPPPAGSLPLAAWLSLFALLGLLTLARLSPRGGRVRRLAPLATLALLLTFCVACGGGSSSSSSTATNSNATPAGTYTLTVTGTSGSLSQSTQVTLKVQ